MSRPDWKRPANGRSGTKINVYIPGALVQRLRHFKGRINVSRVCQEALTFEVERLETLDAHLALAEEWLAEH